MYIYIVYFFIQEPKMNPRIMQSKLIIFSRKDEQFGNKTKREPSVKPIIV